MRSLSALTSLLLISSLSLLSALTGTTASAQGVSVDIISPSANGCMTGAYTVSEPFEGGAINGNVQPSEPMLSFDLNNPPNELLSFTLTLSAHNPAFEQPPSATCPDWTFGEDQVAACGGQGYCIFTRTCICSNNQDCNGGAGVCRPDQTCGCATDEQCGPGQTCNPDGSCSCATDAACGAGQTCLPEGVCSCSDNVDCGEGLQCSNGVCGELTDLDSALLDYSEHLDLPLDPSAPQLDPTSQSYDPLYGQRVDIPLPPNAADGPTLFFTLEGRPQTSFDPVISVSQAFSLDRNFPVITTSDFCEVDPACPLDGYCQGTCGAGLICDPVRTRCDTLANVELGACRPEDDFSQGLPAAYQLIDDFDDNPTFQFISSDINGCFTTQTLLVSDSCGNAQRITLNSQRAPVAGEVSAVFEGFRCFDDTCDLSGRTPDLASGSEVGRAQLRAQVTAPNGCYDYAQTQLERLDGAGAVLSERELFAGEVLQATAATLTSTRAISNGAGGVTIVNSGLYSLEDGMILELNVSGVTELVTFNTEDFFDITNALAIDVIQVINAQSELAFAYLDDTAFILSTRELGEGVTLDVSGSAAVPLGFDPAFESDSAEGGGDGDLRAQLKIFACGAETPIVTNSFDVTVLPVQALSLGGPYQVNQGDALEVSASGDVAPEFGGVSYVEWDTDGDGLYEPTTRVDFDPPLAAISGTLVEGTRVLIDTTEQQAFLVKARFGLASGEVREAQASVEVLDVTPTCLPPQLFVAGSLALSVPIGEDADFDASSTLPGHESDPIISYEWSFGDGASNTVPTPVISHRYLAEGEYTVTFTAHDIDSSCVSPVTFTVRVTGAEPIVENIGLAQPNAPRLEGQPITFSAGDTRAGSSSDPLIEYVWTFGYLRDGQLVEARGAQLEEPAHTYEDDGSYQVCLSVSDSDDTTPPSCFTVEVSDLEPSATFTGPSQSTEGQEVTFNATGTLAGGPSDQLTALRWDFGDGSPIVTTPPDQLTVSHTFISDSGEGTFNVTLTALDEDSEVRTSRSITVLDVRPTANFVIELPLGVLSADEGVAVTLNASASAPGAPSDQITQYHWDFGDGSPTITTQTPSVSYAWPDGPRDYRVTLTVEDSDGSLAVSEQNVSVANVAPVVSVTASDLEPEVGTPLTFTLNVEDVAGDQPESSDRPVVIEWDFGDDATYTTPTVTYTFESEGPKTIRVRYVDGDAGEAEAELSLNVAPRPATINAPVISVIDINGDEVADPRAPIGEFINVTPSPSALFLREGESLTFAVRVDAAQLSTGAFDRANAVWSVSPEGSEATYTALNGGDASLEARLDWTPSFFQAGQYLVRLAAEGEVTGSSVSREWRIYVAEAGTPMLAATTGNQRRGRVLFYSYGRENSRLSFTPSREVEVGMGAVDLVFDEQRARLFVSSPGSSHVAVLGGDPVRVLRNIPTGEAPYDLAWGGGYVWVSEAGARSVSALSPITLKRTRALELPNTASPQSVVWVGAEDGASSPHLIVGDARNGTLTLINALEMLAGNGASSIKATLELGTSLTRIVKADGRVYLADGKRRVIYAANINELINEPSVDRFALFDAVPFAPQDLTVTEDGLWVATGSALWRLDPLTGEPTRIDQEVTRLIPADPLSLGVNGLVLSDGARLENVVVEDDTLTPLVGVDGTRVQRMASFLSRAEAP